MRYQVVIEELAKKHIAAHKRSGNVGLFRKIGNLFGGTGRASARGNRQTGNTQGQLCGLLVAANQSGTSADLFD